MEAPPDVQLVALGAHRQTDYRELWRADARASDPTQTVFPGGLILNADQARMDTLLILASRAPAAWLEGPVEVSCSGQMGTTPPPVPVSLCGFLLGLHWKVPPRPRGLAACPRARGVVEGPGGPLPAAVSANRGEGLVVVELEFKLEFKP